MTRLQSPAAVRAVKRVTPAAAERRISDAASTIRRFAPGAIAAVAGVLLVWFELLPLSQSLWNDEAYSALFYIRPGPSAIFGTYIPNDHMLFELLAWGTTNLLGDSSEAVLRFWSVAPSIAAAALMTWWLWRRLDAWVAAIFAVLAAAAPLYLTLSVQARGYGLTYLAAAVMLIAMDAFMWRRRRRQLVLFAVSAIVGIWSLPVFVLAFLPLVTLLIVQRPLRRDAIWTLLVVGVASLLFYLPVLGDVFGAAGQHFGEQLPWYGAISFPLKDLISPSVALLLPGVSLTLSEVIGGCLVALGVVALWRVPERYLAMALISPTLFAYLFLEVARIYEAGRFVAFLELPLLVLCAVAFAQVGRLLTRIRGGHVLATAAVIVLAVLVLGKAERYFDKVLQTPIENFKEAAALTHSSGIPTVVGNTTKPVGFFYYLGRNRVHLLTPDALESLFCSNVTPFVYLEHGLSPLANTSCLRQRGAVSVSVPQSRSYINVWFVRSPDVAGGKPLAGPMAPVFTLRPLPAGVVTCPSLVQTPRSGANPVTPTPVGRPITVDVVYLPNGATDRVRLTVISTRLVSSVPGAFTARGSTFRAPGRFLAIEYRITNLGRALIKPEETVNLPVGVEAMRRGTVRSAGALDENCSVASASYTVAANEASPGSDLATPYVHLLGGQSADTIGLYPLPTALSTPAAVKRLVWSDPQLGLAAALPPPRP